MTLRFANRREAGRHLAAALSSYAGEPNLQVLALPRGGVPVAYEVARSLDAPLDVFVVRKLGVPFQPELAFGAIASGGERVLDAATIRHFGITPETISQLAGVEQRELDRREQDYRRGRKPLDVRGKTVLLVDDGLATGATMAVAVAALRRMGPARIVVATPVAAAETCERMDKIADACVCGITPSPLYGVGAWYEDFSQTDDAEVRALLAQTPPAGKSLDASKSSHATSATAEQLLRDGVIALTGGPRDFDPILTRVGDARFVLIGEASHGTHEFYRIRAEITKRLISERGFTCVAIEGDWPDTYRVNRYVRGEGGDGEAVDALKDFQRFPQWMWRNADVLDFVGWLRSHNEQLAERTPRVGFYGLDLYAMHASMVAVLEYLRVIDPVAAEAARKRYACFDHFGEDPQDYGRATYKGTAPTCEQQVVDQLVELRRKAAEYLNRDGRLPPDSLFFAEQSARLVRNSEQYYRAMFGSRIASWNMRDRHMAETLEELVEFLSRDGAPPKVVVWAHNSHLGDARATEVSQAGELNVGQIVRERFPRDSVHIGFSTYTGTVTAASDWNEPAERMRVRPALDGSYEALFHSIGVPNFALLSGRDPRVDGVLRKPRLQRAIGVIYRPHTERWSHYYHVELPRQFDILLHYDCTRAVEPLERSGLWMRGELPETYPSTL
ncbi:MAG: erythromycin esterase family protein [Planctomycetota bacterium]